MRNINGNGNTGWGGTSRQVEVRSMNESSELKLPIKQSIALVITLMVGVMTVFFDAFLIGPVIGYAGILLVIIYLWVMFISNRVKRLASVPTLMVGLGLWLRFGWELITEYVWPPIRNPLPLWATVVLLCLSAVVFRVIYFLNFRLSFEIVDPSWPGTISPRKPEYGINWPRSAFGAPKVQVRDVVRPVVINKGNVVEPQTTGDEEEEVDNRSTLAAPGGMEVYIDDAVQYIRRAEKLGKDYRTWKKEQGWDWKYWNSVVRLLSELQILATIEPRKEPRFICSDFDECMKRIAIASDMKV